MDLIGYSQQVTSWVDQILESRQRDPRETIRNCEALEDFAKETKDYQLEGFAQFYLGETYYGLNDIEQLFFYITMALGNLEESKQWSLAARAYNLLAITSMNRGNAPFAMEYYLNGLGYCNQYKLFEESCMINCNIGTMYIQMKDYFSALNYLEEAYKNLSFLTHASVFCDYQATIFISLAKCHLFLEDYEKAKEYRQMVNKECCHSASEIEELYIMTFDARFYHNLGLEEKREECIEHIDHYVNTNFAIMDLFDELYEYIQLLFELEKFDPFWKILLLLESLSKQAKLMYLQKKLLSLKLKYYKAVADHSGYLQAAGLYYEISEIMEEESRYLVSTMLSMRESLDHESRKRRAVEIENEVLVEKSETDALTKLGNRHRLTSFLADAFPRMLEERLLLGVEVLDVDYFKQYNDTYGHQAGDLCLVAVAKEIKKLEATGNIFGFRYGGDEFVLIFEGYTKEKISIMMKKLGESVEGLKMKNPNSLAGPYVTLSQGACVDFLKRGMKVWDFFHGADTMLYQVKKKSRNSSRAGNYKECLKKQVLLNEAE